MNISNKNSSELKKLRTNYKIFLSNVSRVTFYNFSPHYFSKCLATRDKFASDSSQYQLQLLEVASSFI